MFYTETKGELARTMPESKCCKLSEFSAIARSLGRLEMPVFEIRTENAASARKIMSFVNVIFGFKPRMRLIHGKGGRSRNQYIIQLLLGKKTLETLKGLGVMSESGSGISMENGIPWHLLSRQCCRRAYLRGVFLGRGYVQNPEKEYHMEFMTDSSEHAKGIVQLAESFNVTPKVAPRKKGYMVYVKGGDDVAQLLRVMGAHSAVLTLESVRVLRGVRGDVNRVVNCETANVTKAVNAGLSQIDAIQRIERFIGLKSLAPGLQEIAELRLANPEMTLRELGQLLSPPISKSAVNHRMRRLIHIANSLNGKMG